MSDEEKKMTSDHNFPRSSLSEKESQQLKQDQFASESGASSLKQTPSQAEPVTQPSGQDSAPVAEGEVEKDQNRLPTLQQSSIEPEEEPEEADLSQKPTEEPKEAHSSRLQIGGSDQHQNEGVDPTPSGNDNSGNIPNEKGTTSEKNGGAKIKAKPSRSKVARNPFIILGNFFLMLVLVVILAITIPIYVGKNMFLAAGPQESEQVILINQGSGIREIASILEKQGLIRSADIFVYGVGYQDKARLLKAGEYAIPAHASMKDIMDILVNGKSIEHSFTVPEGLTVAQVFDRLAANDILVGDLPKVLPPEGSLMANTVNFTRGTTREQIVKRLREGQQKLVADIWAKRRADLPIKNINDFVTLASIVEKETGIPSERPQVAAVFYNRLEKNMRLQSDPTVIYGLFGGKGKPSDRPIYQSDLDKETPYNTYKINGLPPTPIANPGKDALEAVANPPKTDALYFVADGTGGHVFSKTLDEHNANVRKWRALQKDE